MRFDDTLEHYGKKGMFWKKGKKIKPQPNLKAQLRAAKAAQAKAERKAKAEQRLRLAWQKYRAKQNAIKPNSSKLISKHKKVSMKVVPAATRSVSKTIRDLPMGGAVNKKLGVR